MRFIKIVLLLVITYWTLSHIFSNSSDTDHKRAVAAQQASALAEKTKLTATLKTDREHIVREIGNLIALGEYGDALSKADEFKIIGDPELLRLAQEAHMQYNVESELHLLDRLKDIPEFEIKTFIDTYRALIALAPTKTIYKQKLGYYERELQKIEAFKQAQRRVREQNLAEQRARQGNQILIPSDPGAEYFVLKKTLGAGGIRILETKRVGSSGISYSRRMFDCNNGTVKYLGTGESVDSMNRSGADQELKPIVGGSIADYEADEACN